MNILIIGSHIENHSTLNEYSEFCFKLGSKIAPLNYHILGCSPFPDSADYYFISGIYSARKLAAVLELHYPKDNSLEKHWSTFFIGKKNNASQQINKFKHFPIVKEGKINWKQSWFFCQLQALNKADIIIVIGGDPSGASDLLLRIAETQKKTILPVRKFGGSGDLYFNRHIYEFRDKLGQDYFSRLDDSPTVEDLIYLVKNFPITEESQNKKTVDPTFFISYPRARPAEADFVEMILRRRNLYVLRDEEDFGADVDIPNEIKENIYKSDIFISVWSKEYACSPWCFDELALALERKKKNNLEIWIFCVDDTRIIHPDARSLLNHPVKTRNEIEGKILSLLAKFGS